MRMMPRIQLRASIRLIADQIANPSANQKIGGQRKLRGWEGERLARVRSRRVANPAKKLVAIQRISPETSGTERS